MGNLGTFIVKLEAETSGESLPNVIKYPVTQTMDVTAKDFQKIMNSDPSQPPIGTEYLDNTSTYGTITPAKRVIPVNNYVEGTAATAKMSNPYVVWKIIPGKVNKAVVGPVIAGLINQSDTAKKQETKLPSGYNDSYTGPRWVSSANKKDSPGKSVNSSLTADPKQIEVESSDVDNTKITWVEQTTSLPDVWWATETTSINSGQSDNLPFWLSFLPKQLNSVKLPTFFAIRINPSGGGQKDGSFDIIFQPNQSPKIYDWNMPSGVSSGSGTSQTADFQPRECSLDLYSDTSSDVAGVVWGQANTIGILPAAGGVYIFVKERQKNYHYNRNAPAATTNGGTAGAGMVNSSSSEFGTRPIKINLGKLMLVGGCCSAGMNASAMAFDRAEFSTGQFGAADEKNPGSFANPYLPSMNGSTEVASGGNLCQLPKEKKPKESRLGGRGRQVNGSNTSDDSPEMGKPCGQIEIGLSDAPSAKGSKVYNVKMVADDGKFGEGSNNGMTAVLPPVLHRIRGIYLDKKDPESGGLSDISDDLVSFSESFSTPDNAIIVHTLNIVLYNEGGVHDNFLERAIAVRARGRWSLLGGSNEPFFTGVAVGGSRTEVAGKETLDITCHDYMYVLESTPMVNSPYYDGMDVFAAIADLASRAGIRVVDGTGGQDGLLRQFLGGGYSFSEPVYRFGSKTNLKENIAQIAAQYSMVVWFDGDGVMHVDDLLGGIQFPNDPSSVPTVAEFHKDPSNVDGEVIIGEKRKDSRLGSTCTQILIKSIDASLNTLNEGQFIFGVKTAPNPLLPFKRTFMWDIPALGSQSAVNNMLNLQAQRFFKPATGINIRTIGSLSIKPLSFIKVDGEVYRVDKATRTFNAEDNSFMADLSGEWRGKQSS